MAAKHRRREVSIMFWVLLRARLRMIRNAARGTTVNQRWIYSALAFGGVLLFSSLGAGCAAFMRILEATAPGTSGLGDLAGALLGHVYEYLFFFLLASSVPFVASSLFQDSDLPLLLTTPVSPTAVVGMKMVDATVSNSAQFVVIGLPVLLGLALGAGVTGAGWFVFAAGVLLLMAFTPALSAFLLLVIARIVGIRRIRFIVMMVSIGLALSITLLAMSGANKATQSKTMSVSKLKDVLTGDNTAQTNAVQTMRMSAAVKGAVDTHVPEWLPSTWASRSLLDVAKGRSLTSSGLNAMLGMFFAWVALLALSVVAGRPVVTSEEILEQRDLEHTHKGIKGRGGVPFPGMTAAATGVVLKDLRYIGRDTIMVGQIGTTLILFLVPFVLKVTDPGTVKADFDMYGGLSKLMIVLVVYMVTSILGLSSVGLEGRGAWMLFASPVATRSILWAKWTVAFVVSLVVAVVLCTINAIVFSWPMDVCIAGMATLICICFAMSGLGVGLSGLFPRFLFDNPAHRASVWAMLLGFIFSTIYMGLAGSAAVIAFLLQRNGYPFVPVTAGAWIFFLILTIGFGILPVRAAEQRLGKYQWDV